MPLSKAETARPSSLAWHGSCGVPREETVAALLSVASTPHDPELHMIALMCNTHEHNSFPSSRLTVKVWIVVFCTPATGTAETAPAVAGGDTA